MDTAKLPEWFDELRRAEIVGPALKDPRSGRNPYGMNRPQAADAIGGGQANFDAPYRGLEPDDRALLYAYWNQLVHMEELVVAFGQYLRRSKPKNPIVVDIGCGPFTGGLALAATLGCDPCFDYIGIDRHESMRRLGERLATSSLVPGRVTSHWFSGIDSVEWPHAPTWREVIVIISYLFASPTLDATGMVKDLDRLLDRIGRGAVTLLYTNSTQPQHNSQYPPFRKELEAVGFQVWVEDIGKYVRQNRNHVRQLFYVLFRRSQRRKLILGE